MWVGVLIVGERVFCCVGGEGEGGGRRAVMRKGIFCAFVVRQA